MNQIHSSDLAESGDVLLTAADVAARLNIAKTSTYGLLAKGHITHFRIGRSVRVRETDLGAYLESVRVAQATSPPPKYVRYPQA